LTLSVEERAELANSLLDGLDDACDPSVEAAWESEILRRMEDVDSGTIQSMTLIEARRELPSALD
jgi:putative addiction module component (TIGR02574 family)